MKADFWKLQLGAQVRRRATQSTPAAMGDLELIRRIDAFNRQIGYGLPAQQHLIPLALEARERGLV